MYDGHYERLAAWATQDRFQNEVTAAREEFFAGTGPVHEDDLSFELRMAALSEYYLLDRPLTADPDGRTPARVFVEEHQETLSTLERAAFRGFTRTVSGLFEVRRAVDHVVLVRDVLTGEDHRVHERRELTGLNKGELVQTRLVPWQENLLFGRAVFFHPQPARKLIVKYVKRLRKAGDLAGPEARGELLWKLARLALVHDRQKQNNRAPPVVERIYALV